MELVMGKLIPFLPGSLTKITESLIVVGAFDELHSLNLNKKTKNEINRRDLLLHLQDLDRLAGSKKGLGSGQLTLGLQPPALIASGLPNLTASERVRHEVAVMGMDISNHMMEFYGDFLNEIGAIRSSDLIQQRSGASVLVAGVKVALQTPPIRSGRRVMFLTLDDGYGCNDVTFFEDMQESSATVLYRSWLFLVRGEIRRTGPRGISLRATGAWELASSYEKWRNLRVCEPLSG
jgi:error-prone DNA polymerase